MLAEGQSSILGMGLSDNSVDKSGRTETEWMQDVLLCSAAEGAQCQFFVSVEPEPCFASSLEKEMATYSSTLAWKIPWMEKPGSLQSMGSQRVGHDWATSLHSLHTLSLEKEMATHSIFLPGESHGQRSLAGCGPWGCRESDTTDVTKHTTRKLFSVLLMVWDIL